MVDGDRIAIDLTARSVDLLVDDAELAHRHREREPHRIPEGPGWLPVFARSVASSVAR